MAAANGIVSAKDVTLLASRGGNIEINKDWAKSLLRRMKYVKRKCSNAGKVSLPNLKTIQDIFLADIIPIANVDDKRQITAVLAATLAGRSKPGRMCMNLYNTRAMLQHSKASERNVKSIVIY